MLPDSLRMFVNFVILGLLLGCLRLYVISMPLILFDTCPEGGSVVLGIDLRMMILRLCCLVVRVGVGGYLVTKDIILINVA